MKMGFTGTRDGMTPAQKNKFEELIKQMEPKEFHHGDCIGSDDDAAHITNTARKNGFECLIICHPPELNIYRANNPHSDVFKEPKSYFARNRQIADDCDLLVVCPKDNEKKIRSGTWNTFDRAISKNKKVIVIWPDGSTSMPPQKPTLFNPLTK